MSCIGSAGRILDSSVSFPPEKRSPGLLLRPVFLPLLYAVLASVCNRGQRFLRNGEKREKEGQRRIRDGKERQGVCFAFTLPCRAAIMRGKRPLGCGSARGAPVSRGKRAKGEE